MYFHSAVQATGRGSRASCERMGGGGSGHLELTWLCGYACGQSVVIFSRTQNFHRYILRGLWLVLAWVTSGWWLASRCPWQQLVTSVKPWETLRSPKLCVYFSLDYNFIYCRKVAAVWIRGNGVLIPLPRANQRLIQAWFIAYLQNKSIKSSLMKFVLDTIKL